MLENAMRAYPEALWGDRSQQPELWYVVFHTLFFLDLYLSESDVGFSPPAPFTFDELDERGLLPERMNTKEGLPKYLEHGRKKCRAAVRECLVRSTVPFGGGRPPWAVRLPHPG